MSDHFSRFFFFYFFSFYLDLPYFFAFSITNIFLAPQPLGCVWELRMELKGKYPPQNTHTISNTILRPPLTSQCCPSDISLSAFLLETPCPDKQTSQTESSQHASKLATLLRVSNQPMRKLTPVFPKSRCIGHSSSSLPHWSNLQKHLHITSCLQDFLCQSQGFPGGSDGKESNPPAMHETQVRSLDQEDTLEKGVATHSSIPAWRIP